MVKDFDCALASMEEDHNRDLVILDLRMPGMNGLEGMKRMRELYPDVFVALMSGMAEKQDIKAAMDLGAIGYFPKTMSGKALLQAIQLVLTGEKFVPLDSTTNTAMSSYAPDNDLSSSRNAYTGVVKQKDAAFNKENIRLTPRETEVLGYLGHGASNKEIAEALGLQVVTVKLHVRGVCRKLGAKNRTQAALRARELGVVER